jgi:hypothetical protein
LHVASERIECLELFLVSFVSPKCLGPTTSSGISCPRTDGTGAHPRTRLNPLAFPALGLFGPKSRPARSLMVAPSCSAQATRVHRPSRSMQSLIASIACTSAGTLSSQGRRQSVPPPWCMRHFERLSPRSCKTWDSSKNLHQASVPARLSLSQTSVPDCPGRDRLRRRCVRHQEADAASTLNSMRSNREYGIRNKSCNKVNENFGRHENFDQRMMITGLQVAIDLAVALIDAAVLLRRLRREAPNPPSRAAPPRTRSRSPACSCRLGRHRR